MLKKILRIVIAIFFIISGFVKAVDVIGFSFKLEEYFAPDVFNMHFFEEFSLPIAIFVVSLELILGLMLLLKIRLKITLSGLIALCVFFAFLTFYSAYFNKVTDCGCFGDAIKFTPWQSFWKDIALLLGLLILWILYKKDEKNYNETGYGRLPILGIFIAIMATIIFYGLIHEPIIDFRAYKIGTDLNAEKQKIANNPSVYKTFYTLKNSKTGESLEINQDDYINEKKYWEEGSPWKIEADKNISKLTKKGYDSEISKFKIEDIAGNDITDNVLKSPKAILIFSYNPEKADKQIIKLAEVKLNEQKDALILGISNEPKTFKSINNAMMDATAIKTIARSNPFILIFKNGKIIDKMGAEDFLKN